MANATVRVGKAFRKFDDDKLRHSYGTVSSATKLYTGAMLGLNAGYLAKYDDTASMKFFGIVLDRDGYQVVPTNGTASGTAGDGTLDVDVRQPPAFELAISGVAITDIGRRVYALDDQTGTFDASATTYANLIGVVKDLVYATDPSSPVSGIALVAPTYNPANGSSLMVLTTSAPAVPVKAGVVIFNKSGVIAATIVDPTTGVHDGLEMSFIAVTAQANTLIAPSGFNASGTTATWGGAKGDSLQLVAFGGKWYTNGSPRNITFS